MQHGTLHFEISPQLLCRQRGQYFLPAMVSIFVTHIMLQNKILLIYSKLVFWKILTGLSHLIKLYLRSRARPQNLVHHSAT